MRQNFVFDMNQTCLKNIKSDWWLILLQNLLQNNVQHMHTSIPMLARTAIKIRYNTQLTSSKARNNSKAQAQSSQDKIANISSKSLEKDF